MALKGKYTTNYGIEIPDVYYKIYMINGSKEQMQYSVNCFNVVDGEKKYISSVSNGENGLFLFTPDLNSNDNIFKQAYLQLKSLDVFNTFEDC